MKELEDLQTFRESLEDHSDAEWPSFRKIEKAIQAKIAELKAEIDSWASLTDSAQNTSIESMAIRKSVADELKEIRKLCKSPFNISFRGLRELIEKQEKHLLEVK